MAKPEPRVESTLTKADREQERMRLWQERLKPCVAGDWIRIEETYLKVTRYRIEWDLPALTS